MYRLVGLKFEVCSSISLLQVSLELAADYKHRIVGPARQYPLLLCWLVRAPPREPCPQRRECAATLLDSSDEEIADLTTLKLRILLGKELHEAKDSGTLAEACW